MRQRVSHHQVAGAAGLGRLVRVHRVVRRIRYGLGVCLGVAGMVLAGVLGWTWSGCLLAAGLVAVVGVGYKLVPSGAGLRAVAQYEGGLVLVGSGGYAPAVPWDEIEDCVYVPARHEFRGNLHTEHLARLVLRLRNLEEPLVLTHLGGREQQLSRAVDAALLPRRTGPLHREFAKHGRLALGESLTVLPDGLLIGPSAYFRTEPLPWADLDLVGSDGSSTVNLTATRELTPGSRRVSCQVADARAAAAFVLQVCNATLGLDPTPGVPARESG